MTTDERLDAITRSLDTLIKIHIDNDREYRERFQRLTDLLQQDAENIRALARIAELHEQRLDRLEEE